MAYDVIIIGGGPAGLTAGIYLGRANKKAAILTGKFIGGAITLTENIENFSGHVSIDGFSLTQNMKTQAERFGAEFIEGEAVELILSDKIKKVKLEDGSVLEAEKIILAMGTENRKLGLHNEQLLTGQGVSYCATCDGNFFRKRTVVVNGGGDTALTDALYLSKIAKEVYLVHRRQAFRAADVLVERVKASDIKIVYDSVITELKGEPLSTVTVKNILTNEVRDIETDGLFVAIGTIPNTKWLNNQVETDSLGYIITDSNMRTNVSGVYAAGDIRVTPLRQVITACADGAIAAESAVSD